MHDLYLQELQKAVWVLLMLKSSQVEILLQILTQSKYDQLFGEIKCNDESFDFEATLKTKLRIRQLSVNWKVNSREGVPPSFVTH